MADVFVSYKKEDRKLAERVVEALEREGFSVWWDDDITPRESWDAMIQREAEASKAMVVLWTPRSIASDWVRAEAGLGKARAKLVPFMMEACEPPLAFSLVQAADLTRWRGAADDPSWRKAVQWVSEQCQKPVASAPPRPKPKAPRAMWIAAGVAVLALAGAILAWKLAMPPGALPGPGETAPATPAASAGEPPLPAGELGEAEAARRRFAAVESAPECEGSVAVTFAAEATDIGAAELAAAVDPLVEKLGGCEVAAVLVAGHADAAERSRGFEIGRQRAQAVAGQLDSVPRVTVATASFGSEELAVKTDEGMKLQENRRVEIGIRGLPRAVVTERAYQQLNLGDPRSRAQLFANILFGYDRAQFADEDGNAKLILQRWRDLMTENPGVQVEISANPGNDGESRAYSAGLRMRRAQMVKSYLVSLGVPDARIVTRADGAEASQPGTDVVSRMANRSISLKQIN